MRDSDIPVEDLNTEISPLTKNKKLLIKFLLIPSIRERQGSSPLLSALGYFHDDKVLVAAIL